MTMSFVVVDTPISSPPVLVTAENTDVVVAFNAATFLPEPFELFTEQNFNADKRTRVILFATNTHLSAGVEIRAENATLGSIPVPVEFVGTVPNFPWLVQIVVRLPDELANRGDVWLRFSSGGTWSNQARINIR
jgi:uncharacterized protein (TIGR03437 family)